MKALLRAVALLLLVVMVTGAAGAALVWASPSARDRVVDVALAIAEPPVDRGAATTLAIPEGAAAPEVARLLASAGLVRHPTVVRWALGYYGVDRQLKAGSYTFAPAAGVREVFETLRRGTAGATVAVTVPEGLRAEEVAAIVERSGAGSGAEFLALVRSGGGRLPAYPWLQPGRNLEGFLFPDTYHVPPGYGAGPFLGLMLERFDREWGSGVAERLVQRGLNAEQAVTLASIIERETPNPPERPLVAGVFLNRLEIGMPLAADPTVQFALAQAGPPASGEWWKRDLTLEDLRSPSLYNTYVHTGLPPGPICSPGGASLRAVAEPQPSPYLFFVAKPDGTHAFAATFEGHQANIARYQR